MNEEDEGRIKAVRELFDLFDKWDALQERARPIVTRWLARMFLKRHRAGSAKRRRYWRRVERATVIDPLVFVSPHRYD